MIPALGATVFVDHFIDVTDSAQVLFWSGCTFDGCIILVPPDDGGAWGKRFYNCLMTQCLITTGLLP